MVDLILERFWDKVIVDNNSGCWNFNSMNRNGYGRIKINRKIFSAHRFAYEVNKGKIPSGLTLDHLCKNRSCVNPEHLEPVTLKENILRGTSPQANNAKKSTCINGHPLTGKNLYINPASGQRVCRACKNKFGCEYVKRKASKDPDYYHKRWIKQKPNYHRKKSNW